MFTSNGNTVTGLMQADLNSPEDEPKFYGPYPVNRAVEGLAGNAKWLVPGLRNGILLHTGEWPDWQPPQPMPNSAGCVHAWPDMIDRIQETLVAIGVEVRPNTSKPSRPGWLSILYTDPMRGVDGELPYPYKPQGLLSVFFVDE